MSKVTIQIPIEKDLRDKAVKAAKSMGFSSLQESIRIWLHQIVRETPLPTFEEKPVKLSKKNDRRYAKMIDDVESGRVKTRSFADVDKMMKYLNS